MELPLRCALLLALLSLPAAAQLQNGGIPVTVVQQGLDDSLTNWTTCSNFNSCAAGGTGTPTAAPTQTTANGSPTLDNNGSMALSFNGPKSTNVLWSNKAPGCDDCTDFYGSWWFNPGTSNTSVGQYESDMALFSVALNTQFMWGLQCDQTGGFWQIFNQAAGLWENTAVACSLSASTWYHIQYSVYRIAGDTNACSGVPCEYYRSLTINGVTHMLNAKYGATTLPANWKSNIVIQFQMNTNAAVVGNVTVTDYYDEVNFQATEFQP